MFSSGPVRSNTWPTAQAGAFASPGMKPVGIRKRSAERAEQQRQHVRANAESSAAGPHAAHLTNRCRRRVRLLADDAQFAQQLAIDVGAAVEHQAILELLQLVHPEHDDDAGTPAR